MSALIAAYHPALPLPAPRNCPKVRSAEELRCALRASDARLFTTDLSQLDRVLRLDARAGRIEVQSGVSWGALATYLAAQSIVVPCVEETAARAGMPGTLGDCVGSNTAAPDGTPFLALIEALTIVTADGELRRASRNLQQDLFYAAIGGRGLIGAVYSVTLRLDLLVQAFANAEAPVELGAADHLPATDGIELRLMVPPARLAAFLAELRQTFEDFRLPIASLSVRKAFPETETLLCWATEELALVDLRFPDRGTLPARVAATQVRRSLIAAALANGGRFDLATGLDASREQVEAGYPRFSAFLAEKRRYDPQGRLDGPWYRHYLGLFRREACEVRWAND